MAVSQFSITELDIIYFEERSPSVTLSLGVTAQVPAFTVKPSSFASC